MGFGRVVIKLGGTLGGRQSARICLGWRHSAEFPQQVVAIGKPDVGLSTIGIFDNGLSEIVDCAVEIIWSSAIPEIAPLQIEFLSFGIGQMPIRRSLEVWSSSSHKNRDAGDKNKE